MALLLPSSWKVVAVSTANLKYGMKCPLISHSSRTRLRAILAELPSMGATVGWCDEVKPHRWFVLACPQEASLRRPMLAGGERIRNSYVLLGRKT